MAKKSKKAAKKAAPKKAQKPAPKAAPKPAPGPAKKPAAKAAPKAGLKPAKKAVGKAKAPETPPPAPEQVAASAAVKKPKAPKPRAEKAAPSARPAPKPHVHAAAEPVETPPGRSRKAAAGPVHNGIGDEAVRKATGKGWEDWLTILDEAGAKSLDHKAIVAILHDRHEVGDWWAQMVAVGYEQARGLREKNQTASGFQASMSKTIAAPVARLYRAWADESEREKWLGDVPVEVRVANEDKNLRLTWLKDGPEQGTSVEVGFFAKDAMRGMVQVQQNKLENAEAVARVRAFWSVKLETLRSVLEK